MKEKKNCYYSSSRVTGLGFPVLSDWFLLYQDTSFGQVHPLARYLLCLDTSFGQISPLTRYLLWLDTSFGQTPSLTWNLLRQHISSGNISPTVPIKPSSFHSFRLTASQIVHPTTVGSWRISSSSPCESWCATNLHLLHSLCSRVCAYLPYNFPCINPFKQLFMGLSRSVHKV